MPLWLRGRRLDPPLKSPDADWFKDIYNRPLYLRLYESLDRASAAREARSAAELLGLAPPERVLDVACGFGRHVAEFERLGIAACGVDLSAVMLGRALSYAREAGLPARYVRADLRSLPFHAGFDAATNFFVSFGYLNDEENARSLAQIAGALRPGGRFLMDTWNAAEVIGAMRPKFIEEREDVTIVERWRYVAATRRIEWFNEVRFRDGQRQGWGQSIRAYTPSEFRGLFEFAGFRDIRMFGDWDGSAFGAASPRLLILAHLGRCQVLRVRR